MTIAVMARQGCAVCDNWLFYKAFVDSAEPITMTIVRTDAQNL